MEAMFSAVFAAGGVCYTSRPINQFKLVRLCEEYNLLIDPRQFYALFSVAKGPIFASVKI
jgi:hypothetical protein